MKDLYVQLTCAGIMLATPVVLMVYLYFRHHYFVTARIVQFLALAEIVPAVVILGLQQVLDKGAAGTILAGIAGYVLGTGDFGGGGPRSSKPNPEPLEPLHDHRAPKTRGPEPGQEEDMPATEEEGARPIVAEARYAYAREMQHSEL